MQKTPSSCLAIGKKPPVHHHRIMHGITPDLEQGNQHQYRTRLIELERYEQNVLQGEMSSAHHQSDQNTQNQNEDQHLEQIGPE
ncbi:MAG: hypothetical protein K1565_16965 [Candidatus Thiodiazotropha sp. (ex. Lucinisca nassula)]|nr:hypothetical protein [Candidatus Thiodiazotropha sp. (ex. Lucinisca nassula)]